MRSRTSPTLEMSMRAPPSETTCTNRGLSRRTDMPRRASSLTASLTPIRSSARSRATASATSSSRLTVVLTYARYIMMQASAHHDAPMIGTLMETTQVIADDGVRLAIHVHGAGEMLLCLPGGPMLDSAYFRDLGGLA